MCGDGGARNVVLLVESFVTGRRASFNSPTDDQRAVAVGAGDVAIEVSESETPPLPRGFARLYEQVEGAVVRDQRPDAGDSREGHRLVGDDPSRQLRDRRERASPG